jgi:hypothetical protein
MKAEKLQDIFNQECFVVNKSTCFDDTYNIITLEETKLNCKFKFAFIESKWEENDCLLTFDVDNTKSNSCKIASEFNHRITNLLKRCDYVFIKKVNNVFYCFLINMKSEDKQGSNEQLSATLEFMIYSFITYYRLTKEEFLVRFSCIKYQPNLPKSNKKSRTNKKSLRTEYISHKNNEYPNSKQGKLDISIFMEISDEKFVATYDSSKNEVKFNQNLYT